MTTFRDLGLPDVLSTTLAARGITEPFPIQAASIADALSGADICGKAPTGSGKTLAFGLPLLARVERARSKRPRALVLSPTRELADQITTELAPLAKATQRSMVSVYGGVAYGRQINGLRNGADVVVACPGRLEDLIEQGAVSLRDVDIVVVDEADRMADMGFLPAVRRILDQTSSHRQTLLFSATLDGEIATLTKHYQRSPRRHETPGDEDSAADAVHHFWKVERTDRVDHTAAIVSAAWPAIVFTRTRHGADRLAKQLAKTGLSAASLHGGRSQNQRSRALQSFSSGKVHALVATDVAARGIHVDNVATVVHYDPPNDEKDYIHRSGRTARAGATGQVVSLIESTKTRAAMRMQRQLGIDEPIRHPAIDRLQAADVDRVNARKASTASRNGAPTARNGTPERETNGHRKSIKSSPAADAARSSIYVSNLPWSLTDADLSALFDEYGKVYSAAIITDRKTRRSRGFGFVEMASPAARRAVEDLEGVEIDGRAVTVGLARPKKSKPRNDPGHTSARDRRHTGSNRRRNGDSPKQKRRKQR